VERIRQRVQQELHRRLLENILEQGIEYHTRRRIRWWCDCSYCNEKRRGTADITHGTRRYTQGQLIPGYILDSKHYYLDGDVGRDLPPCDNIDDAIRNRMERVRERLRIRLRANLMALKLAHKFFIYYDENGEPRWKNTLEWWKTLRKRKMK
jgi:hypothetical protein